MLSLEHRCPRCNERCDCSCDHPDYCQHSCKPKQMGETSGEGPLADEIVHTLMPSMDAEMFRRHTAKVAEIIRRTARPTETTQEEK